jgi:hypothetical protein
MQAPQLRPFKAHLLAFSQWLLIFNFCPIIKLIKHAQRILVTEWVIIYNSQRLAVNIVLEYIELALWVLH